MTARKHIQALRLVALIEGLSWLVLIGAMVYRSQTGDHEPVAWTGRVHGGLFCLFALVLFLAWLEAKWTLLFAFLIGLSSLIPLGFLFADPFLRKKLSE
ncbi:MAG: DUF3817 domain-containing protein [Roseibacillus sp.]